MNGPCHFVVFGATGHLATTKLLPSLYQLELAGRLDEALAFVAFARRDWDTSKWQAHLNSALVGQFGAELEAEIAARLVQRFEYVKGDHSEPAAYRRLLEHISTPTSDSCKNVVFYLAIPPGILSESSAISKRRT